MSINTQYDQAARILSKIELVKAGVHMTEAQYAAYVKAMTIDANADGEAYNAHVEALSTTFAARAKIAEMAEKAAKEMEKANKSWFANAWEDLTDTVSGEWTIAGAIDTAWEGLKNACSWVASAIADLVAWVYNVLTNPLLRWTTWYAPLFAALLVVIHALCVGAFAGVGLWTVWQVFFILFGWYLGYSIAGTLIGAGIAELICWIWGKIERAIKPESATVDVDFSVA